MRRKYPNLIMVLPSQLPEESVLRELRSLDDQRWNSWRMTVSMLEDSQQARGLADAASATIVLHERARRSDRLRSIADAQLKLSSSAVFCGAGNAPPNADSSQ